MSDDDPIPHELYRPLAATEDLTLYYDASDVLDLLMQHPSRVSKDAVEHVDRLGHPRVTTREAKIEVIKFRGGPKVVGRVADYLEDTDE